MENTAISNNGTQPSKKENAMSRTDSIDIGQVAFEPGSPEDPSKSDETELSAAIREAVNHRRLNPRQIQLTAIAGSIGASVTKHTFHQPDVTLTIRSALFVGIGSGFAQTSFVIFEATVINTLVEYWGYNQSPAVLISISLVLYLAINVYRADLFGEAEFWLALGKVLLATGLIVYTIVVMLGGNPLNDRFGFRYWKDPGPWAGADPSNRLMSFVNAVNVAAFCMGGPEYISMIAGESRDPRRTVPRAFSTIMTRLIVFFIGGCLCVGILVPYNDQILTNGSDSYAADPLNGRAPKFLKRLNKRGVPYMAVIVVMVLSCLAYLALGSSSAEVLNWILNFCTAATMFNWTVMSFTWIRFNAALNAQGIDKKSFLPRVSRFQPYAGYWAFFWAFIFLCNTPRVRVQGYAVFIHGNWKVSTFIFNYGISKDIDLVSGLDFFDALTEHYRQEREAAPVTVKDKIMAKVF
ncbi:hypothetical protein N7519_009238 [Penicillium mononematosum]|uniref:uncharacterized protein n=1 Tax=Penicillium mononematosum TaxID=268346 RepID=UPI002546625E|nr:uncharacterized protein N7519_009238 [Penicillium mononematosum]KAJ6178777.1 hypothetical protein N7519_009238 [Penicillium mononematosum]